VTDTATHTPTDSLRKPASLSALFVDPETPLLEVLRCHSGAAKHDLPSGIALVVDPAGVLVGTITDGDVRRAILREGSLALRARDLMTESPIALPDTLSYREIVRRLPLELQLRNRRARHFLEKIVLVDSANRPTRVLDYHQLWEQRVASHRHIAIVGMGYVGLTLALVLAEEGFRVTGVDTDAERIRLLLQKDSYIHEQGLPELLREQMGVNLFAAQTIPDDADVFIVSVGTPVRRPADGGIPHPSLVELRGAAEAIGEKLAVGGLVVLRSTVPVGTTRGIVQPILEARSGLKCGVDFHLVFAPERTAEGQAIKELRSLPQIIGGVNEDSVEAAAALFRDLTSNIVRMESCESAELAKLINNCFRDVVFGFANEVAQIAAHFNLDIAGVIKGANQGYPRDPVPLPSPGVGGPCLTKDPYILNSVAEQAGLASNLSLHGRRINESMHSFTAERVLHALAEAGKDPAKCRILVCGLAFKGHPETGDLRDSSGVEIARYLASRVAHTYGHDPVASPAEIAAAGLDPVSTVGGTDLDAVLFLNNHRYYESTDIFSLARSLRSPGVILDGWHTFRADEVLGAAPGIYLGLAVSRSSIGRPFDHATTGS
jgi:UDP-N-acetyl-D-mannosaminuronic acid dehydrogenase